MGGITTSAATTSVGAKPASSQVLFDSRAPSASPSAYVYTKTNPELAAYPSARCSMIHMLTASRVRVACAHHALLARSTTVFESAAWSAAGHRARVGCAAGGSGRTAQPIAAMVFAPSMPHLWSARCVLKHRLALFSCDQLQWRLPTAVPDATAGSS